jgi:hypothetical protein
MEKVLQLARNIFEIVSTEEGMSPEERRTAIRIASDLLDLQVELTEKNA